MADDVAYWQEVLQKAQNELEDLRAARDEMLSDLQELNDRIVQLERLAEHVAPLTTEESATLLEIIAPVANLPLADACREILRRSNQFRTARAVRDSLEASGYNLKQHNNPLASIHGVLKRLVESGEVEPHEHHGSMRYRWKDRGVTGLARIRAPWTLEQRELSERRRAEARAAMAKGKESEGGDKERRYKVTPRETPKK